MKYFDNIIFYLQRSGGGSVYWGEMIKHFNQQKETTFIEPSAAHTENIVRKEIQIDNLITEKKIPLQLLRYLPETLTLSDNSFFHSSYYRFSNQKTVRNIVTVHDFVYERYVKGIKKYIHHKQKKTCVYKAAGIVCISENTKKDLLKFMPGITLGKVKVIYNGVSTLFNKTELNILSAFRHYDLFANNKVVIYIGFRNTYKHFDFAVEVIKSLHADYHFVIIGPPLNDTEKKKLAQNINGRHTFLGNVSNNDLNSIYNLSHCLLYPSGYEGFGIPILEAFRCGCPVIALNASSIPEVAGKAALLCSELNVSLFKEKIISVDNVNTRKEFAEAGWEQQAKFSWDKCYEELNDFYDTIEHH